MVHLNKTKVPRALITELRAIQGSCWCALRPNETADYIIRKNTFPNTNGFWLLKWFRHDARCDAYGAWQIE